MAKFGEDSMEQRLRWMRESVQGAYNAVHPPGHDHAGDHCVNSGTCILVCCYINALGKVLLKGGPTKGTPKRDFVGFQEFIRVCMSDFLTESNARGDLPRNGDNFLYTEFRCGFVHGYPKENFAWGRSGPPGKYWFVDKNRFTLNIDEFVSGFERGIEEFRRCAAADPHLRSNFIHYITAD